MLIHDLKHPVESITGQLKVLGEEAVSCQKTIAKQASKIEVLETNLTRFRSETNFLEANLPNNKK